QLGAGERGVLGAPEVGLRERDLEEERLLEEAEAVARRRREPGERVGATLAARGGEDRPVATAAGEAVGGPERRVVGAAAGAREGLLLAAEGGAQHRQLVGGFRVALSRRVLGDLGLVPVAARERERVRDARVVHAVLGDGDPAFSLRTERD